MNASIIDLLFKFIRPLRDRLAFLLQVLLLQHFQIHHYHDCNKKDKLTELKYLPGIEAHLFVLSHLYLPKQMKNSAIRSRPTGRTSVSRYERGLQFEPSENDFKSSRQTSMVFIFRSSLSQYLGQYVLLQAKEPTTTSNGIKHHL